jgi:adenylosuccinate lyase
VTIGKRATIWLQDFLIDFESLEHLLENLPFRGVKGTTGTQASFLALFNGDHDKVKALNTYVTQASGFKRAIGVSGQTYTRKIDFQVVSILSQIAQSAYKLGGDIRLLANLKEIEEPFGAKQVGSSAMAYKRNPMRSERMCSLARYVISMTANTAHTACNQWLERTLDDSANRRLSLPEAFLGVDVCLTIASDVINGLHVWPNIVRARVKAELPFMATEVILMAAVQAGGDRQVLHEAIRDHSMAAAKRVKVDGAHNDLLERIAKDDLFASVHGDLDSLLDPMLFIGRSSEQVDEFLSDYVDPVLAANSALLAEVSADQVEV